MEHFEDFGLSIFKQANEKFRTAAKKYALQQNVFKWSVFPVNLR